MVEWKYVKSSYGYYNERYYTSYKEHTISVIINDGRTGYILQWRRNGNLEVQKHFDASNFDEAKAYAIGLVKDYISGKAMYWRDTKIGFTNWVMED